MSLKTVAFLALVGMALLTILLAADFINTVTGVSRDVVPAMALLRALIYLMASLTVAVLFYVLRRHNLDTAKTNLSIGRQALLEAPA